MQIGQEAAAEVRKQYPMIQRPRDPRLPRRSRRRLVAATPAEYRPAGLRVQFTPVNLKEINAFALPGGPMFVNRGHDRRGVTRRRSRRRHGARTQSTCCCGTAPPTPPRRRDFRSARWPAPLPARWSAAAGDRSISQGSQFGLGTWLMKYSREYEKQADLLGAQIMARAGYDPRDLGADVRDHPGAVQGQRRAGVDEQPPQPGQPLDLHRAGGRAAPDRRGAGLAAVCRRQARAGVAAPGQVDGGSGARQRGRRRRECPRLGGAHGRAGAGALERLSRRARRPVVPDLRARRTGRR